MNVAVTRPRRHLVSARLVMGKLTLIRSPLVCVIGDSSAIQHGNSYLKKWMAWLEENADLRFAGDG